MRSSEICGRFDDNKQTKGRINKKYRKTRKKTKQGHECIAFRPTFRMQTPVLELYYTSCSQRSFCARELSNHLGQNRLRCVRAIAKGGAGRWGIRATHLAASPSGAVHRITSLFRDPKASTNSINITQQGQPNFVSMTV